MEKCIALKAKFVTSCDWVDLNIPNLRPDDLGMFYGLKMQVTRNGQFKKRSSLYCWCDWHEKAKHNSWKTVSSLTQQEAMERYVAKVDTIIAMKTADFKPTKGGYQLDYIFCLAISRLYNYE